jgi:alcohol dehydrogenase
MNTPTEDSLRTCPECVVAIDLADTRLEAAKHVGANVTMDNGREGSTAAAVKGFIDGLDATVDIETVGTPAMFELATDIVGSGGHIATTSLSTVSRPPCTSRRCGRGP